MCGFAVAIGWPEAEATVARLIEGIQHRGDITDPLFTPFADVAMCTRRLRIVDAEHGMQPQISFYGRLAVSFNGEIYNHVELRQELEALGVGFRTHSDTEVLANALQVWGHRALERLNGMYAFVAVDLANGEFLAARDPFGVKPLYVMQQGASFLFCSEMKPLIDTVPAGDVMLLPPGYALSRNNVARYRLKVYPRLDAPVEHSAKALDAILRGAVERRLPPGLPVATWFSGGIDSTLVAHYARQFRPDAPGYFVGGTDAPDYRYAEAYAEKTGYDMRVVPFDPQSAEAFASIDDVVVATESFEPNLIRGAVCSLVASIAMHRDGFRVGLCGEGADELFCGYAPLEIAFRESPADGAIVRDECLDLMHRVSLQRVDRTSMRHSLEMREPFLDPAVVNYALGLDASALVRDVNGLPTGKMPLRDLYDLYPGELPSIIRDRTKVPFGEGAGLDTGKDGWMRGFEAAVSDADFRDGQKEFAAFKVQSKEELYYLRKLASAIDVNRVPHLKDRAWISFPVLQHLEKLKAHAHFSL
ncbi:MAG: asparagine synthase-related protein [Pseudolabrys sp.]|jgi:asparagine synthase (glutamine-hydrolysing)